MLLPRLSSSVIGGSRALVPLVPAKGWAPRRLYGSRGLPCFPLARYAIRHSPSFTSHCRNYSHQKDPREPSPKTPEPIHPAATVSAPRPSLSKTLHEDIYTIPNLLTLSRLAAAPFVGYFILQDNHAWALGLLAYSGVTDLLDGWIARRWNLTTVVGTIIDPLADKTLMAILTVSLAVQGSLPVWLAVIILGRDVGLAIAAIYYRWVSLPPPKTFTRYWDFSLPSAEVHPTAISKYNTFLQLALIGLTTAAPVIAHDISVPLTAMQ
ncbi:hypothetical protein VDGD_06296 [Verticillium dahliae]|nr:hypothetical protein VDGD_06296 [Verticillium dahliae]